MMNDPPRKLPLIIKGGNVFTVVCLYTCLSVCLSIAKVSQKRIKTVMNKPENIHRGIPEAY